MNNTSSSHPPASPGRRPRRLARASAIGLFAILITAVVAVAASGHNTRRSADATASPRVTATLSAVHTRPDPYAYLPKVPSFTLTSTTIRNGHPLPKPQLSKLFGVPGGKDISPQLSWHGFPAATKSFIVSMYDPEAPTGGGFWHWVVVDLPATTTSLKANAGRRGGRLPRGAFDLLGDAGVRQYVGGAPPPGSGVHDYYVTVTALNVKLVPGITRASSADYTGFVASGHTIARATIVAPTEIPK
jgi:Raf kinase inhibitor-like YbhB/YbcL family protein